ncbi:hypothetical protein [Streptomyces purpurogeneiscleroticus]|uniref:hypothetical protein n=1 Tax=Streptomyces purpurogeneiscleroticus TaxID=68259 RepID=UPI001CBCF0AC|nr:hypothetical protein [Streptomyces purpurogeneiscleroticus]MBZ4018764.1 hypothetical protein [Streptomyces purpurogeneiscleroticus]
MDSSLSRHRRVAALVRAGTLATSTVAAIGALAGTPAHAVTGEETTAVVTPVGEEAAAQQRSSGDTTAPTVPSATNDARAADDDCVSVSIDLPPLPPVELPDLPGFRGEL